MCACLEGDLAEADRNGGRPFFGAEGVNGNEERITVSPGCPGSVFLAERASQASAGEGRTRDVSVLGAFIAAAACPPVETPILVEFVLPFFTLTGEKTNIRIQGEALVIRVDHPSGGQGENGFAVVSKDPNHWGMVTSETEYETGLAAEGCLAGMMNHE